MIVREFFYATQKNHDSKAFTVDVALHLASLSSLSVLFRTCPPRMEGWSTTIINALGRCWVGCLDIESQCGDSVTSKDSLCVLKKQLRETAALLAHVNPGITKVCLSLVTLVLEIFLCSFLDSSHLFSCCIFVLLFSLINHLQVHL